MRSFWLGGDMQVVHWTGVLLLAAGCGGQPGAPPYQPASSPATKRPASVARFHDPAFAALGRPSLAAHGLAAEVREIRFSRGHGWIAGPEYVLIRIIEGSTGVRGEIVRARLRVAHEVVAQGADRWRARLVAPSIPIDWTLLLERVDSLGIGDLEPPSYAEFITDSGDLLVEVRRASEYRAYEVNAPGARSDPVGLRAARIAHLVDSLDRLTRGY